MDLTVKTYEEMAKDVFFARDEYEKMKKKQKKLAVRICAAALVLSVGAGAVFAAAFKGETKPALPTEAPRFLIFFSIPLMP